MTDCIRGWLRLNRRHTLSGLSDITCEAIHNSQYQKDERSNTPREGERAQRTALRPRT